MFFQDDDEYLYAYHNTKLLLREYSRLYWARTGDDDVIVRVLHAKTPKEILSITQNERAMYSVDAVLQFLLLVSGAIALVEYYPIKGKQYADVLKLLVSNRSIILTDGTMAYLREKELSHRMGIAQRDFTVLKQEAMTLLSLLLWGYDGQVLIQLLSAQPYDSQIIG